MKLTLHLLVLTSTMLVTLSTLGQRLRVRNSSRSRHMNLVSSVSSIKGTQFRQFRRLRETSFVNFVSSVSFRRLQETSFVSSVSFRFVSFVSFVSFRFVSLNTESRCKHVHSLELHIFIIFVLLIHQLAQKLKIFAVLVFRHVYIIWSY